MQDNDALIFVTRIYKSINNYGMRIYKVHNSENIGRILVLIRKWS